MQKEHLIDFDRKNRIGIPETIFCLDKDVIQIRNIFNDLDKSKTNFFTRLSTEKYSNLPKYIQKKLKYDNISRTAIYGKIPTTKKNFNIAIICAGTSDMPAVTEAQQTLISSGEYSKLFADVGVAGLWRIQKHLTEIKKYKIIIVAAGMDGALVSVLGGLISQPIIAVPTSTGYGVSNNGKTALNAMLASCSPGITLVNIDNGYGAATAAIRILNAI